MKTRNLTEEEQRVLEARLAQAMAGSFRDDAPKYQGRRDKTGPFRALAFVWAMTLAVLACVWAIHSCSTAPETQPVMELR